METPLIIGPVDPATVVQRLKVCQDPLGAGMTDLEALVRRSDCVHITAGNGHAGGDLVLALQVRENAQRRLVWIAGAAGQGYFDWTKHGLSVAELKAQACGAQAVAFQTARRGLVRRAESFGYQLAGYILIKAMS